MQVSFVRRFAQVQNGIADQLPRPVIGDVSAPIHFHNGDVFPRQLFGCGEQMSQMRAAPKRERGRVFQQQKRVADLAAQPLRGEFLLQSPGRAILHLPQPPNFQLHPVLRISHALIIPYPMSATTLYFFLDIPLNSMYTDAKAGGDSMARDVTKGDIPVLVLAVLSEGPSHGYAIARRIEQQSANALSMKEGTLYPALRVLEQDEMIAGAWEVQPSGPARKVYRITAKGQADLTKRRQEWEQYVTMMNTIMGRTRDAQSALNNIWKRWKRACRPVCGEAAERIGRDASAPARFY